jgi:hypothetical protein
MPLIICWRFVGETGPLYPAFGGENRHGMSPLRGIGLHGLNGFPALPLLWQARR